MNASPRTRRWIALVAVACLVGAILMRCGDEDADHGQRDGGSHARGHAKVVTLEKRLAELTERVGQGGNAPLEDAITSDQVRAIELLIKMLPLDILRENDAKRLIAEVLAPKTRATLRLVLAQLAAVHHFRNDIMPGTRAPVDVRGQEVTIGDWTINMRGLGLDSVKKKGPRSYWVDIVYVGLDGTKMAVSVVDSLRDLQDEATARRVTRIQSAWELGGPDRKYVLYALQDGGGDVLSHPLGGVQRPPQDTVADFERIIPAELQEKTKKHFDKPGQTTVAVVSVIPPSGEAQSLQSVTARFSGDGDHAEDLIQGDINAGAALGGELGSPDQPTTVMIALNRSNCPPCAVTLRDAAAEALRTLAPEKRANITFTVAVRGAYEGRKRGGAKGAATLASWISDMEAAGFTVRVIRVDGKVTERGQWLVEILQGTGSPSAEGLLTGQRLLGPSIVRGYDAPEPAQAAPPLFAAAGQKALTDTAVNALFEAPTPPGGIDFSSLELRYLAGIDSGTGVKYALQARAATVAGDASSALQAAQQASDAFFVWLALPPASFTVNLNPTQPDQILDAQFARTDAGRVLLDADLRLKKTTATLIHPNTELGRQFWNTLLSGRSSSACFSLRTWIQPGSAKVQATDEELYILDAPLSVQTESRYLQQAGRPQHGISCHERDQGIERRSEELFRSMILPKLNDEVNHSPEYQDLRGVYLSRIAAQWVRDRSARTRTAYSDIIDSGNIDQWKARTPWNPLEVFERYVKSFTEGEYNVTWDSVTADGRAVETRFGTYGGIDFSSVPHTNIGGEAFQRSWSHLPALTKKSLTEISPDVDGQRLWVGGGVTALPHEQAGPWRGSNPRPDTRDAGAEAIFRLGILALIVLGWSQVIVRSVRCGSGR